MENNDKRLSAMEERLSALEEQLNERRARRQRGTRPEPGERREHGGRGPRGGRHGGGGRHRRGEGGPGARMGRRFGRRSIGRLIAKADELNAAGIMSFAGLHRNDEPDGENLYMWGLRGIKTDDVLGVDDARNIKVLSALAHPVRLRMMKSILQQPGTAAELRDRLELTSNGQTYHALNLLENGGMIEQQPDGTYTAVAEKAAGFLILLGGLFQLTEGDDSPAFLDIEIDDEDAAEDDTELLPEE